MEAVKHRTLRRSGEKKNKPVTVERESTRLQSVDDSITEDVSSSLESKSKLENPIEVVYDEFTDKRSNPSDSESGIDTLYTGTQSIEQDRSSNQSYGSTKSHSKEDDIFNDLPDAEFQNTQTVIITTSFDNNKRSQLMSITAVSNMVKDDSIVPMMQSQTNSFMSDTVSVPLDGYQNYKLMEDKEAELKPFTDSEMSSLYFNQELYNCEALVGEFIENEINSGNIIHQKLYGLLMNYLNARDNYFRNTLEFESFINDYAKYQQQLWTLETTAVTEYEECQDGNPVSATHRYQMSRFNQCAFVNLTQIVSNVQQFSHKVYAVSVFNVQAYKIKVDSYVQTLCSYFSYLPQNSPVGLHCGSSPRGPIGKDHRLIIIELKEAISALFCFQRRPIKDDEFITETRVWLEKLLGVLLRIAAPDDHLFILNHVLRCPAGFGKWAAYFVQPPVLPYGSSYHPQYLDHLITMLAELLLPIKGRELFLQQMETSLEENGMWVIIDSDTEEMDDCIPKNALKENDIIAVLNQIPFGDIYRQIMLISRRHEQDIYDINMVSDRDMLRAIAISTLLVLLLEKGMANYSLSVYKQFCKRLSRFINHTALYITDHFQLFRDMYTQRNVVDSYMLLRLQTEYDAFLLRVVHILYMSQNRIGWQYLTTLPFNMITSQTLWRLYQYLLRTDADSHTITSQELMDNIIDLPSDDVYYFLTTITNMALDRQKQDWLFIQTVTLQLFQAGFVNTSIRDSCMKSVRILLTNLTSKHPSLISDLMVALKRNFSLVGKLSLHLFNELPLSAWKPTDLDVSMLGDWLLTCRLSSWENNLARYVISHLNWSLDLSQIELFLPRELHYQVAMIIVKAVISHAEETITAYGVTYGVTRMVRSGQTPEHALCTWAWQILSMLKIHLMDQPDHVTQASLRDSYLMSRIPDINSNSQDMQTLSNGISNRQSVAYYMTLLSTNVGHSVPVICETGFLYCNMLLSAYKYSQVLHILHLVIPYFISSPESLHSNEQFNKIIVSLINADRTYMKVAKSYIVSEYPGTVLSQFASMIQYQINNFSRYGLCNANSIIELWLRVLCSVWMEDCGSVAYLMDKVLCYALFDDTLKLMATDVLAFLVKNITANLSSPVGGLSSILSWVPYAGGKSACVTPAISLLPRKLSKLVNSPFFAYFALDLEEFHTQVETHLWTNLLKTLHNMTGKANIDNTLKKVCISLKMSPITSELLAIYRWSQYALDLPCECPITPLIWQRFFMLYLQRVPETSPPACVGTKFFEGAVNGNYQKKLKAKLQQCVDYAAKKETECEEEKHWFLTLETLYRAYILWLEDSQLHDPVLFIPALSVQFNPQKLEFILQRNEDPWLEYVNVKQIQLSCKESENEWRKMLNRSLPTSARRILCIPEDTNPMKRIFDRLKSYDTGLPPPPLVITLPVSVPPIQRDMLLNKHLMAENISERLKVITQHTKNYYMERVDQLAISKKLLEALRNLYSDVETEVKLYAACDTDSGKKKNIATLKCAGPALIRIRIQEAKLDAGNNYKVERCNKEFERILKHSVRTPSFKLTVACITIEQIVETLVKEKQEVSDIGDVALLSALREVSLTMFYKIALLYNTEMSRYSPSKKLIQHVTNVLGEAFVLNVENECSKLLNIVMSTPRLSSVLMPHFNPISVPASVFIRLYETVVKDITVEKANLIFNTISKFDISSWLVTKKPRLNERSQFITVLSVALRNLGLTPAEPLQPVHDAVRKHFCQLLLHEFPEHYGEILHIMLNYSKEEKFSIEVWYDVLNSMLMLANSNVNYGTGDKPLKEVMTPAQVREVARKYASGQKTLTYLELVETANILGTSFLKERLNYGLYGLYPKYNCYIEPLIALNSIVGHAAIASMLQMHRGTLADKMCEQIWPVLQILFAPWILPYFTSELTEPAAPWIQQLTEDRSVLLPWVVEDGAIANKMMATFTECIRFVLDALPASSIILHFICQWYINHFAHPSVKDHVLNVVHSNLLSLAWSRFEPDITDMEAMLRVVDKYLPSCHSFLGLLFMEIPWHIVAYKDLTSHFAVHNHVILLHLLIKLANEPGLRQSGKVSVLLMEAKHYSWNLVDVTNYEPVLNWFIINYDPRVILQVTNEDWNAIDISAFDLLQVAAGYVAGDASYHSTTLHKRQLFVRACVKMILNLANRYKTVLASHHTHLSDSLTRMLDKMESVLNSSVPPERRGIECGVLLTELLVLVNQPAGSILIKLTVQALLTWVSHRSPSSAVLQGLLGIVGKAITDHQQLGAILEACITAWFKNSDEYDWEQLLSIVEPVASSYPPIEDTLVANNQILSLYTLTMKQLKDVGSDVLSLGKIVNWIINVKPVTEVESKLPLLWSLLLGQCGNNKHEIMPCLTKFSAYLQQLIQMKQGWALLEVIGLNKQTVPSTRCRLLCYALNAFVITKMLEQKEDFTEQQDLPLTESIATNQNTPLLRDNVPSNLVCMKAVTALDSLLSNKHFTEFKVTVELAVRLVRSKDVTLYQGDQFLISLAKQLYTDGYIHAFPIDSVTSL